ncbi:MAG: serine/threonine protein kinase [Myxococcales bacterium]|nr:serine/threonine protein kinase [Myxococcales bacterium]
MLSETLWKDRLLFERWRLQHCIYAGGMSSVFQAQETETQQWAAIKILHPNRQIEAAWSQRFLREAQLLSQLQHPHIVQLLHAGQDELLGCVLVMEWLDGYTLQDLIKQRSAQIGLYEVAHLFFQICSGLDYIHQRRLLHRDLKPGNIFLLPDERQQNHHAKIIDFGIARPMDEESPITQSNTTLGTPLYMAPEQAQGQNSVDPRTDLYALAVMLFETLTREVPFHGKTAYAIMASHVHAPPPYLRERDTFFERLPELEETLLWGMAKTPEARPRDLRTFWGALLDAFRAYAYREDPAWLDQLSNLELPIHKEPHIGPYDAVRLNEVNCDFQEVSPLDLLRQTPHPISATKPSNKRLALDSMGALDALEAPSPMHKGVTPRSAAPSSFDALDALQQIGIPQASYETFPPPKEEAYLPHTLNSEMQQTNETTIIEPTVFSPEPALRTLANQLTRQAAEQLPGICGAGVFSAAHDCWLSQFSQDPEAHAALLCDASVAKLLASVHQAAHYRDMLFCSEQFVHYVGFLSKHPRSIVFFLLPAGTQTDLLLRHARKICQDVEEKV